MVRIGWGCYCRRVFAGRRGLCLTQRREGGKDAKGQNVRVELHGGHSPTLSAGQAGSLSYEEFTISTRWAGAKSSWGMGGKSVEGGSEYCD